MKNVRISLTLLFLGVALQAQDAARSVAGGGISVAGWMGIDWNAIRPGTGTAVDGGK